MTATPQDFLEQQRAARAAELQKCKADEKKATRGAKVQVADNLTEADLKKLHDDLLDYLRPDKSIYFGLVLPHMRNQPQLSFAELPNLNHHLADAYPLWHFEQVNKWWCWTAFTFYCCSSLDNHCITIKATPI